MDLMSCSGDDDDNIDGKLKNLFLYKIKIFILI